MKITLFGALAVQAGDHCIRGSQLGGIQPRAVLEMLLLARGHAVSKERIADMLWGEQQPRNTSASIEQSISVLRRKLFACPQQARSTLCTERNAYRFDADLADLDIDRFDDALQLAAVSTGDDRYTALNAAVACARHELLLDAPYAPWASEAREHYRCHTTRAHLALAKWHLRNERPQFALHHCDDALRFSPYCEEAYRLSMIADSLLGHVDLAHMTYLRCTRTLRANLGATPSAETLALAEAIRIGMSAAELVLAVRGTDAALPGALAA